MCDLRAAIVRAHLGDGADDIYRIWWVQNSTHASPQFIAPMVSETEKDPGVWSSRLVEYDPVTAQALRDMVAWCEHDIEPHASTRYHLSDDNALVLAATASERGGVQPVVTVTVDGGARVECAVGAEVTLIGVAEVPPGAGTIVRAAVGLPRRRGVGTIGRRCRRPIVAGGDERVLHVRPARHLLPELPRVVVLRRRAGRQRSDRQSGPGARCRDLTKQTRKTSSVGMTPKREARVSTCLTLRIDLSRCSRASPAW
jgi:hypothetical protein